MTWRSHLSCFVQRDSELFEKLLHKTDGDRAEWEYPFAVAGVNLTFMLGDLLDLRKKEGEPPVTAAGRAFVVLLADHSDAFELVSCCRECMF
jgi:hypothetical protein